MDIEYSIKKIDSKNYSHKLTCDNRIYTIDIPYSEKFLKINFDSKACRICGGKILNKNLCKLHYDKYSEFFYKFRNFKRFWNTGYSNPSQNPDTIKKRENNYVEKYGVKYSPDSNKKRQQTNFERYGDVDLNKVDKISNKMKVSRLSTIQERYGVDNVSQINDVKDKKIETTIKNYGVTHPKKSSDVVKKSKETFYLNKYGVKNLKEIKEDFLEIANKIGFHKALDQFENLKPLAAKRHFYPKNETRSIIQLNLKDFFESETDLKFELDKRSIVPGNNNLEIDLLDQKNKVSIEFDGVYWHQGKKHKELHKAELMRSIGYTHINIDETTVDKIGMIKKIINPNKMKIFARKCEIKSVDKVKDFLNKNHLQGYCHSKINYGLFYENELIQVMTFGHSRFNINYQWEIIRLCTHSDYLIIGGAEKLWKHFVKNNTPKSVISYSDNRYFSGNVYKKLNFKFDNNTDFNYVWWHNGKFYKRYQTQRHKLEKLFNETFPSNYSETLIMESKGCWKNYDLGNKRWTWNKYD